MLSGIPFIWYNIVFKRVNLRVVETFLMCGQSLEWFCIVNGLFDYYWFTKFLNIYFTLHNAYNHWLKYNINIKRTLNLHIHHTRILFFLNCIWAFDMFHQHRIYKICCYLLVIMFSRYNIKISLNSEGI